MWKRLLLIRGAEVLLVTALAVVPLAVQQYALGLLTCWPSTASSSSDWSVPRLPGPDQPRPSRVSRLGRLHGSASASPVSASPCSGRCRRHRSRRGLRGLLAFPALRLEGPQFALATLCFTALTTTVLNEWESLTDGAQGFVVSRPPFVGFTLGANGFYWFCLFLLILVWHCHAQPSLLPVGKGVRGAPRQPDRDRCDGGGDVPPQGGGLCARFRASGGLAGGLYAFNFQYLQPQAFTYELMVILLLGRRSWRAEEPVGGLRRRDPHRPAAQPAVEPAPVPDRLRPRPRGGAGDGGSRPGQKDDEALPGDRSDRRHGAPGGGGLPGAEHGGLAEGDLRLDAVFRGGGIARGCDGVCDYFLARLFRIAPPALPPAAPARFRACHPGGGRNAAAGDPGSEARLRGRKGGGRDLHDGALGSDPRSHRSQRVGQEHGGERRFRPLRAHRRADPASWKAAGEGEPVPGVEGRGVAHLPEPSTLQRAVRAGERDGGAEGYLPQIPPLGVAWVCQAGGGRAQAESLALLSLMGLEKEARTPAKDLTYGAQRFLEIARALARKPDLLILDEPADGQKSLGSCGLCLCDGAGQDRHPGETQ